MGTCSCCPKTDLGCFNHNEDACLNIDVILDGEYQFVFTSPFSHREFTKIFEDGDEIYIPTEWDLNENILYELKIIGPDETESCYLIKFITNNTQTCTNDTDDGYCG